MGMHQRSWARTRRGERAPYPKLPDDLRAILEVLERARWLIGRPDAYRVVASPKDAEVGVYSLPSAIEQAARDLWNPNDDRFKAWYAVEALADESRKQCYRAFSASCWRFYEAPPSAEEARFVLNAGWQLTFTAIYGDRLGGKG